MGLESAMDGTAKYPESGVTLDIFGQRLVTIFTQIGFCFPLPAGVEVQSIVEKLQQGLAKVTKDFPWLAGQVVCRNADQNSTGVFYIEPLDKTPRLYVKDLTNESSIKSMDELRQLEFPMSALEESIIAPRNSYSGTPGETVAEVFQLQVNLIRGGIVLTFLGQHQSMDGIGMAQVLNLLSKACRGEDFAKDDVINGNLERENIVPLLDQSWKPGQELNHNIVKDDPQQDGLGHIDVIMPQDKGSWRHFNLSDAAIKRLKSQATSTLPSTTSFVSSDDAISAFIWQSITKARAPRFDPTTIALLTRAVDLRRPLNIPQTFPGMIQCMTYHNLTRQQIIDSPLGPLAANLRAAVDPQTSGLAYYGRSLATLISRTPDRRRISFLAGFDMAKDVMISSWANQNLYELDFGLGLGQPEAVRRPHFDGFQGLVYLLPRMKNGDIGIAVCLDAHDMDRLMADEEFCSYAKYIG